MANVSKLGILCSLGVFVAIKTTGSNLPCRLHLQKLKCLIWDKMIGDMILITFSGI
jgi:hypothetical protein